MGVENILVVVYLWHHGMPGQHTKDIVRNVIERTKDLLSILHQKLLEAEKQLVQQQMERQSKQESKMSRASTSKALQKPHES